MAMLSRFKSLLSIVSMSNLMFSASLDLGKLFRFGGYVHRLPFSTSR
jgi:hypothetical protein